MKWIYHRQRSEPQTESGNNLSQIDDQWVKLRRLTYSAEQPRFPAPAAPSGTEG